MMKPTRRIDFDEFMRNVPGIFASIANRNEVVFVELEGSTIRLESAAQNDDRAIESEDSEFHYDPEKVKEAVEATAGSWADLDVDKVIAALYKAREDGSRPIDRP